MTADRKRSAVTKLELVVSLAIGGIVAAILFPAIQRARESVRRATCQNNLRQQGLAVKGHESSHARIPSLYYGTFLEQPRTGFDEFHFHSWQTAILPQLEQQSLFETTDLSLPATDASNQASLNTRVTVFLCPSTPKFNAVIPDVYSISNGEIPGDIVGTAERTDYEAVGGVHFLPPNATREGLRNVKFGVWGEPIYDEMRNPVAYRTTRLRDVSDGLSSTILIGERAGRPDAYSRGNAVEPYYSNSQYHGDNHQAARGVSTLFWWLVSGSNQAINQTNITGIFSFHPSGANVAFADGSVRFLSESIDQDTLNALSTRSAGDIATLD